MTYYLTILAWCKEFLVATVPNNRMSFNLTHFINAWTEYCFLHVCFLLRAESVSPSCFCSVLTQMGSNWEWAGARRGQTEAKPKAETRHFPRKMTKAFSSNIWQPARVRPSTRQFNGLSQVQYIQRGTYFFRYIHRETLCTLLKICSTSRIETILYITMQIY